MHRLCNALILCFILAACIQTQVAAAPECRGAVIVSYISFSNLTTLRSHLDYLKSLGVNAVFVDALCRGFVLYPGSSYLPKYPGYPAGWDPMAAIVQEAHARGMEVYAWMEYGFFAFYNNSGDVKDDPWVTDTALGYHQLTGAGNVFRAHPTWWSYDRSGNYPLYNPAGYYHFIYNPINPEVQDFFINLYAEICQRYDIDGLNLDRIRYANSNYTYDSYTRQLYASEHNGIDPIDLATNDPTWLAWKKAELNDFMRRLRERIHQVKPNMLVFANVTTSGDIDDKCQDYPTWSQRGYLDILAPMNYTTSASQWNSEFQKEIALAPQRFCFWEGLNCQAADSASIGQMIDYGESIGAGFDIWFSSTLAQHEPTLKSKWTTPVTVPHPPVVYLTYPRGKQILSGDVPICWNAWDKDADQLSIEVDASTNGGMTWSMLASNQLNTGSFIWHTKYTTPGVNYMIRVRASDERYVNGDESSGVNVLTNNLRSVSGARAMPDGSIVGIQHAFVTAGAGDFNGRIYIESSDRTSGLAVITDDSIARGSEVTVAGSLTTVNGERVLSNAVIVPE